MHVCWVVLAAFCLVSVICRLLTKTKSASGTWNYHMSMATRHISARFARSMQRCQWAGLVGGTFLAQKGAQACRTRHCHGWRGLGAFCPLGRNWTRRCCTTWSKSNISTSSNANYTRETNQRCARTMTPKQIIVEFPGAKQNSRISNLVCVHIEDSGTCECFIYITSLTYSIHSNWRNLRV